MERTVRNPWLKVGILLSFIVMVGVNALANLLPLNGVNTGEVSDAYQNLFTPAPLTFAIWGVIYLGLLGYVIGQLTPARVERDPARQKMLVQVGVLFILSSLANAGWIFAWHYRQIALSMAFMVLILAALLRIGWLLRTPHCNPAEELTLRMPFGLYIGWITVATIANATALLVSLGWSGFGLSQPFWTVAILLVGTAIAGVTMYQLRNAAYGLAVLWAYVGILIRHASPAFYAGAYPILITFSIVCLVVLLAVWVVSAIHMRRVAACQLPTDKS